MKSPSSQILLSIRELDAKAPVRPPRFQYAEDPLPSSRTRCRWLSIVEGGAQGIGRLGSARLGGPERRDLGRDRRAGHPGPCAVTGVLRVALRHQLSPSRCGLEVVCRTARTFRRFDPGHGRHGPGAGSSTGLSAGKEKGAAGCPGRPSISARSRYQAILEQRRRAAGALAIEPALRRNPALTLAGILALAGVGADLQALWPLQALMPLQASESLPHDGLFGVCAFATATKAPAATNADAAAMTKDFFIKRLPRK